MKNNTDDSEETFWIIREEYDPHGSSSADNEKDGEDSASRGKHDDAESTPTSGCFIGGVYDKLTYRPIPGASIALTNGLSAITDEKGNFSIINIEPGTYRVIASSDGYVTQSRKTTVTAPETIELEPFQLTPICMATYYPQDVSAEEHEITGEQPASDISEEISGPAEQESVPAVGEEEITSEKSDAVVIGETVAAEEKIADITSEDVSGENFPVFMTEDIDQEAALIHEAGQVTTLEHPVEYAEEDVSGKNILPDETIGEEMPIEQLVENIVEKVEAEESREETLNSGLGPDLSEGIIIATGPEEPAMSGYEDAMEHSSGIDGLPVELLFVEADEGVMDLTEAAPGIHPVKPPEMLPEETIEEITERKETDEFYEEGLPLEALVEEALEQLAPGSDTFIISEEEEEPESHERILEITVKEEKISKEDTDKLPVGHTVTADMSEITHAVAGDMAEIAIPSGEMEEIETGDEVATLSDEEKQARSPGDNLVEVLGISGSVNAQPNPVYQGVPVTIVYSLTNVACDTLDDITVNIVITEPDADVPQETLEVPVTCSKGSSSIGGFVIGTIAYKARYYNIEMRLISEKTHVSELLAGTRLEVKSF